METVADRFKKQDAKTQRVRDQIALKKPAPQIVVKQTVQLHS
jgi:hypothetical protein